MRAVASKTDDVAASAGSRWVPPRIAILPSNVPTLQRKSSCACGGDCPRCKDKIQLQTKLAVSEPGDFYEREADRVAEHIMRMPVPHLQRANSDNSSTAPHSLLQDLGPGRPLDSATRDFFEPRFDRDFRHVRVHTGEEAAETAQAINAFAYTTGDNIVFAEGRYAPGTTAGDRLIAHELAHTIQQSSTIHRTIGDGHDLTAAAFSGEKDLEDCFDREKKIQAPNKGTPVEKIQQALEDLGFSLPKFGVDGEFGDETKSAVMEFQKSAGLTGADVDGVVGARTIGLLDVALRHGHVMADTDTPAEDFVVKEKFQPSKKEPMTIFFTQGSAALDKEEEDKMTAILGNPTILEVWLEGLASEEGSAEFNRKLAEQRTDVVADKLAGSGITIHKRPNAEGGLGDVNYKKARSVKIQLTAPTAKKKACKKGDELEPCPDPHKDLVEASRDAVDLIDNTKKKIPKMSAEEQKVFDKLFRTDDASRDKVAKDVLDILDKMQTHIGKMPDADAHKCASECHPTCQAGSPAFNRDKDIPGKTNTPGVIFTCTTFKDEKKEERAIIIVHEGHHGTPDIPSRDFAYPRERLIVFLDTETALKNAASFHLLIKLFDKPNSEVIGPEKPDVHTANLTDKKEQDAIDQDVAWLEEWITKAVFGTSEVYAGIREARQKGMWKDKQAETKMEFIAPRFDLTPPPQVPSMKDQTAMAAIYDRVELMDRVFGSPLRIDKTATGEESWQAGPGAEVTVTPTFFLIPPSRQIIALLEELVHATPGISPHLEPGYVAMIDFIRIRKGIGGPTP